MPPISRTLTVIMRCADNYRGKLLAPPGADRLPGALYPLLRPPPGRLPGADRLCPSHLQKQRHPAADCP